MKRIIFLLSLIIISANCFAQYYNPYIDYSGSRKIDIIRKCSASVSQDLEVNGLPSNERKGLYSIQSFSGREIKDTVYLANSISDCNTFRDFETTFVNKASCSRGRCLHPSGVNLHYKIINCDSLSDKNTEGCNVFLLSDERERFALGPFIPNIREEINSRCSSAYKSFNKCTLFLPGMTIYIAGEFAQPGGSSAGTNLLRFREINQQIYLTNYRGYGVPSTIRRAMGWKQKRYGG